MMEAPTSFDCVVEASVGIKFFFDYPMATALQDIGDLVRLPLQYV